MVTMTSNRHVDSAETSRLSTGSADRTTAERSNGVGPADSTALNTELLDGSGSRQGLVVVQPTCNIGRATSLRLGTAPGGRTERARGRNRLRETEG